MFFSNLFYFLFLEKIKEEVEEEAIDVRRIDWEKKIIYNQKISKVRMDNIGQIRISLFYYLFKSYY